MTRARRYQGSNGISPMEARVDIIIVGEDGGRSDVFRAALADFGLDWDVCWLEDASAALALPQDRVADVVVVDMQLGGASLLNQLRGRHPDAVRVLLVDRGKDSNVIQALDCAHRVLMKPLDAAELIEAVESVVEVRELLDNAELKEAVGRIGSLPPPPRLYIDLTQLLRDPEASTAEIAEVLSMDPGVAAKVLRLSNSAYFSGGRVITDVRNAVTRLGHQTLNMLVLASETFGAGQGAGGRDREAMQDRALRTSQLAARVLGGSSADLAATAGLLAEVGLLMPGVRGRGDVDGNGPHYAEAGAYLLGLWGLPMPIVEAVAHHHRPGRLRATGFWVTGAVHVASAIVAGAEVDEDYLRSVGVIDRLPRWRSLGEQIAEAA